MGIERGNIAVSHIVSEDNDDVGSVIYLTRQIDTKKQLEPYKDQNG